MQLMSSDYAKYDPTGGERMRRDLGDAYKRRMAIVSKSARIGAKRGAWRFEANGLGDLGDFSWSDTLTKLGTQLVSGRIAEIQGEQASAQARLATAEAEARAAAARSAADTAKYSAEAAATRSSDTTLSRTLAAAQAGKIMGMPPVVFVIGLVTIAGAAYFVLKK